MKTPNRIRKLRNIRRHINFDFEDAKSVLLVPRRLNTRRRRRLARLAYCMTHHAETLADFKARFGAEIMQNAGRDCIKFLNEGGSLKSYSAWSGIRVRDLNHAIHRIESLAS